MTIEQKRASRSARYVENVLLPLMNVLGGPIRTFYLAIGHAQVTSWALMAITVGAVGYMWTNMVYELNYPVKVAEVAQREASLRETEQRIADAQTLSGVSGRPTWALAAFNIDHGTQTFAFTLKPVSTAVSVIVQWNSRRLGQGLLSAAIPTPDSSGFSTVQFPFPAEWQPGDDVTFQAFQEMPDGGKIRWLQGGRTETIQ